MNTQSKIYGYYDRADQPADQPTVNPPLDAPCLFCGKPLTNDDMRTHSMLAMDGAERSFFYRTHRTCHEAADDQQRNAIDGVVWDSIVHHGDGIQV
jgi:hypothetical protein